MSPASFELRQFDLIVALRKAIRRMCGISPVRVRLDVDWQNGKQRLHVHMIGPAVWVQTTNEMLELSFSAVLAPRNAQEERRASSALFSGDAARIGLASMRTGRAVDSIRITRIDTRHDLRHFSDSADVTAEIDVSGVVCLSDCTIDQAPDDSPAEAARG